MNETSALEVAAVRAAEVADGGRDFWSDDDRAWASRAAAEVVGADAPTDAFLARRAALALERIGTREPGFARAVRALRWRSWIGTVIVAIAFAIGVLVDQVDRTQRINILAPPVLILLAWNIAVYAVLVASYVVHYGEPRAEGPLRRWLAFLATGGTSARARGPAATRRAFVALVADWSERAAPLYAARAMRILHVAAAALALGVVAGLYVRGLGLEYLASWQSTFIDAATVHRIVAIAYAPGAWLTGLAVPGVDAIEAMRAPAGVNAAAWIHRMAGTVALVIVVPRLVLALAAWLFERHRAARVVMPVDDPYFARLLRGLRGGVARVRVVPYGHAPAGAVVAGLEAVVARVFGGTAALTVTAPVAYGDDVAASLDPAATTLVLFDASATPEREVQGAALAALAHLDGALACVDESAWASHWADQPSRIAERRAAWQRLAEDARVRLVVAAFADPDLAAAENAIEAALARHG
jgi:hypothetical protein